MNNKYLRYSLIVIAVIAALWLVNKYWPGWSSFGKSGFGSSSERKVSEDGWVDVTGEQKMRPWTEEDLRRDRFIRRHGRRSKAITTPGE